MQPGLYERRVTLALTQDLESLADRWDADQGRVVHIHALRHSFGTHLTLAGVAPRVAQAAMRHSNISLTMTTYTDPYWVP